MFSSALIIGLLVFIIITVLIFIFVKKVLKALFLTLSVFLVISLILSFFIYKDVVDMQKNLAEQESLIFMDIDGTIITGVFGSFSGKELSLITDVSNYNEKYASNDFDSLLGQNYKLFVFKEEAFADMEEIIISDKEYSSDFIITLLKSDTPIDDYIKNEAKVQDISNNLFLQKELRKQIKYSDIEFKAALFGGMISKAIDDGGFVYILSQYKSKNAIIYKETLTFKFIKALPLSFIKRLADKGKTKIQGMILKKIGY